MNHAPTQPAAAIRWCARGLGVLILLFWGFFLIAHLAGAEGRASRPLTRGDHLVLSALLVSLAGLALAWKRERAGAAVTLAAVAACAAFNWKVLLFPCALIPAAAALHLLSWWAGAASRRRAGARIR